MKYLITGGAGFIGTNFCYYMVKKHPSDSFVCLDALTYAGNLHNIEPLITNENFRFIKGDICNKKFVMTVFEKENFDFVINFAAETHVDRAVLYPEIFVKVNVLGTQNLLEACLKFAVKRYHQVSTDEVYGDLPLDRTDLLFTENSYIRPSSVYSASKASSDLLVLAYHRTFGLPCTISRCSNNYGPYQYPEKLIPLMICNAQDEKKLPVYGNGMNVRDWLHVEDHCSAIDLIIHKSPVGEIYNVGGNNEKTNIFIVKLIIKELNKSENLIEYVADRKGHDLRYAIDASKLRKLGWEPKYSFETGMPETIKWYVNNKKWLDDVRTKSYSKWINEYYAKSK